MRTLYRMGIHKWNISKQGLPRPVFLSLFFIIISLPNKPFLTYFPIAPPYFNVSHMTYIWLYAACIAVSALYIKRSIFFIPAKTNFHPYEGNIDPLENALPKPCNLTKLLKFILSHNQQVYLLFFFPRGMSQTMWV